MSAGAPAARAVVQRRLLIEYLLLFVLLPLLFYLLGQRRVLIPSLWLLTCYAVVMLKRYHAHDFRVDWNARAVNGKNVGTILLRFAVAASTLAALTWHFEPQRFLAFPQERPAFWALVMVLYPLLSVVPQEIFFRSFLFRRYEGLLPRDCCMVLLSAMAFSFAHVALGNMVAMALCLAGGWLFASTYAKHRSLALVSLEHALYGCFVFTIGLGHYFYSGAMH